MDLFGLKATKTLRRLIKLERMLLQMEICYDHGKYGMALRLLEKQEKYQNEIWDDLDWSEDEIDRWFMERGKLRSLRDPSYNGELMRTLSEWKRRNR